MTVISTHCPGYSNIQHPTNRSNLNTQYQDTNKPENQK